MHMKRPKIVCGWGCAPDPAGGAYDAPQPTPRPAGSGRGYTPIHSSLLDAFDRCNWTFEGHELMKERCSLHTQFLPRNAL